MELQCLLRRRAFRFYVKIKLLHVFAGSTNFKFQQLILLLRTCRYYLYFSNFQIHKGWKIYFKMFDLSVAELL